MCGTDDSDELLKYLQEVYIVKFIFATNEPEDSYGDLFLIHWGTLSSDFPFSRQCPDKNGKLILLNELELNHHSPRFVTCRASSCAITSVESLIF